MPLLFERADFGDEQLASFLQAHLADMEPTAPAESRHALDLEALQDSEIRMWVGRLDSAIVATGALAPLAPRHEELKSMRTDSSHRGQGHGRAVLDFLIQDACDRGISRLSLETGSMDFFAPARRLYSTAGFEECGPFGSYRTDPNSTFMTLRL